MFDHDKYIQSYRNLNNSLKEYGVPIILQIAHGGGQTNSLITGEPIVAPSKFKYPLSFEMPKELSETEIKEIISNFIKAIERAKLAGFDGVQLHAAHGYLLSGFLSPYTNKRSDMWGGNTENRFRIIKEIIQGAREKVGSFPILMKYSACDKAENVMRSDEAIRIALLFQESGGDAIEVSCGGINSGFNSVRVKKLPVEAMLNLDPELRQFSSIKKNMLKLFIRLTLNKYEYIRNYNVKIAERIKSEVDIPIIAVGGIRSSEDIQEIITNDKADFVALCRPFIIEPDIVKKFIEGKQKESRCIDCGYCMFGVIEKPLKCYYGKLPKR
jgi:2,4-dienoyl-CoA reductase-like NADH-dependent reductase (Old Yellow Enzyme family)